MSGPRTCALVFLLVGCTDVTNAPATDPSTTLSETVFVCDVQPVLITQCSFNACHGKTDSALRVFSLGKLRAKTAMDQTAANAPLTTDETHANFLSASAFAAYGISPDDNFLLRKPLPAPAGGYEHLGGAVFSGTNDSGYAAIERWLQGATTCN
ncbi:MAG: hypothetical protein QM831_11240 [Kofleriaceae bacterium]